MRIHILYTLLFFGLFSSCRVSRNIQTSSVNVDSVVKHVKDSMELVRVRETTELTRMLEEMTSSGVTFTVDSCPERDRIYALLDSAGKANYEKMRLEERLKSLSNKVTISEKGAITAEGNIKAAYFTNSKLQEELFKSEVEIDRLTKTTDSLNAQLTKSIEEKSKVVEKRPGFTWYLLFIGLTAGAVIGWIAKSRLSIIKSNSMNKVTMFLFMAMGMSSCGKFKDGTSVWADGVWIIPTLLVLGGLWFIYLSYRASKSNSTQQNGGRIIQGTGNIKKTSLAKFWGGVILIVVAIGVVIYQNTQK